MTIGNSQFDLPKPAKAEKDLFAKSVKGGAWVFALRISLQIIFTARYLVFIHFIAITDMGLLGIATLMIDILNKFTNTGFNTALIQKADDIGGYLDIAWTVNIIRSAILFAILYFVSLWNSEPRYFAPSLVILTIACVGLWPSHIQFKPGIIIILIIFMMLVTTCGFVFYRARRIIASAGANNAEAKKLAVEHSKLYQLPVSKAWNKPEINFLSPYV